MRASLTKVALLATLPVFAGCGGESALSRLDAHVLTDFGAWCSAWALHCPAGLAPNLPDPATPWGEEQWRSALAVGHVLDHGAVDVTITRSELDDPALPKAADLIGLGHLFSSLSQRLDADGVQEIHVGGGAARMTFAAAGERTASSGLLVQHAAEITFTGNGDTGVSATGLTVRAPSGAPEALKGFAFVGTNTLDWQGASGYEVDEVPVGYLFEQVIGVDIKGAVPDLFPDLRAAAGSLLPLARWLASGRREVELGPDAFAVLARELPGLVSKRRDAEAAGNILKRMRKITSTQASRSSHLVTGEASEEIRCAVGGHVSLRIAPQFTVEAIAALGTDGVRITMTGISAKPMTGLIRPEISMRTVDLTPHALTVHNVPFLGTYSIDLDDPANQDMTMDCGGA